VRQRLIIVLAFFYVLTPWASGQSVDLYGLQVGPWPAMKANILTTGANGTPVRPIASDISLWEDGVPITPFTFSCNSSPWKQPASVVLSIDVSNSMSRSIPPEVMALAKRFGTQLVSRLTLPPSAVALQVCDDAPQILLDFTSNAQRLAASIAQVKARGGNDFVEHLFDQDNGVLPVAQRGTSQRSVVLVTDAFWEALAESDIQNAISICTSSNIRFFVVILTERERASTGIVESFRRIADASGGGMFAGIVTDSLSDALAATLATRSEGAEPCTITWDGRYLCPRATERTITVGVRGVDTASFTFPPQYFEKKDLVVRPEVVQFTALPSGQQASSILRVTARTSSALVTSIVADDPAFTIVPSSFVLAEGDSTTLTVTYTSDGRTTVGSEISIVDPTCTWTKPVIRVTRPVSVGTFDIDIVDPNGKEQILAGSDTIITWKSGDSTRPVDVDVTINYGATWIPIARGIRGTSLLWAPVPRVESNTCLARVTSTMPPLPDSLLAFGFECSALDVMPEISDSAWSGSMFVGTAYGFVARGERGYSLLTAVWQPHADTVTDVAGHLTKPSLVLTGSVDGTCALHSGTTTVRTINHGAPVRAVQFGVNGPECFTAGDDGRVVQWDYNSGALLSIVAQRASPIIAMRLVGADTIVIVMQTGDVECRLLSNSTALLWTVNLGASAVRSIDVHTLHHRIAIGTIDGKVYTIDQKTGIPLSASLQVSPSASPIVDVAFGNDNPLVSIVLAVCENGEMYSSIPFSASNTPLTHYGRPARCAARRDGFIGLGWSGSVTSSFVSPDPVSASFTNDIDVVITSMLDRSARKLVTVSAGGWVWMWDVNSRRPTRVFKIGHIDPLVIPVMSSSGQYLVSADDNATITCTDIFDSLAVPRKTTVGAGIYVLKFDQGNDALLGVGTGVGVTRINIPGLSEGSTYPSSIGEVIDFAWNADGTMLAMVEPNSDIRTIDMVTGDAPPPIPVPNIIDRSITSISWHPNGTQIFAGSGNNLSLIDVPTRRTVLQVDIDAPALEVSVSPTGTQVVVVHDNRPECIQVFDAVALTPMSAYGSSLGSKYAPLNGRFAYATLVHTTSSSFGAGVLRSLGPSGSTTISDVSDTLFSIVWPRLSTSNVDMGSVRVAQRRDSTVDNLVRNATMFSLRADSIRLRGVNAAEYRITVANIPGALSPLSQFDVEVTFIPAALGLRSATCFVFVGRDTALIELTGTGVEPSLVSVTQRIDMGSRLIGSSFDTVVAVLRNVAPGPTSIKRMCLLNNPAMPFRIVEGAENICGIPRVIAKDDTLFISLRFTAQLIGRVSTLLEVETDDQLGPYTITVLGAGIGPTVVVRSDSGFPGDMRPIVMEMRGVQGALVGGVALKYQADLLFDRSVVVAGTSINANGSISTNGTWNGTDSVIGSLPATIVLGTSDTSLISITRFVWLDEQGAPLDRDIRLENGVYRVLGICTDNGKRFFDPNTSGKTSSVAIVTERNGIGVHLTLKSDQDITIDVLTLQGRSVHQQQVRGKSGQLTIPVDLVGCAHGTYIVRVMLASSQYTQFVLW